MVRFKDFPCLYYVCANTGRADQVQFFGALAAMFGLSPKEAADASELFAHTSDGALFSGKGIDVTELLECSGTYFDSPYKDCRSFYRKAVIKKMDMKGQCCVICPYAAHYANGRITDERIVLKSILLGSKEAFKNNLTPENFYSFLPISCSNNIGKLPIIKFHAILYEYLLQTDGAELDMDKLFDYMFGVTSQQGLFLAPDVLRSFLEAQIRQILNTEDYSLEMVSVSLIRLYTPYVYTPEKLVFPSSVKSKPEAKKKNEQLNKQAFPLPEISLEQLFLSQSVSASEETPVEPGATLTPTESIEKEPLDTVLEVECTPADEKVSVPCDVPGEAGPEMVELPSDEPFFPIDEVVPCAEAVGKDSKVVLETFAEEKDIPAEHHRHKKRRRRRKRYKKADSIGDAEIVPKMLAAVRFRYSVNKFFKKAFQPYALPSCVTKRCDLCRLNESFHASYLRNSSMLQFVLYQYCAARYALVQSGESLADITEQSRLAFLTSEGKDFLPLRHSSGCAFATGDEVLNDCVYAPMVPSVSDSFRSYIVNCTGNDVANMVDFITEACNSHHISIESIVYDHVQGLLFYVNGKFYFFNPHYETAGFLKPLFSDATKVRFYSINSVPVHSCLYELGFKQIRIESVAAFYSTAIGVRVLFPTGLIFDLERGMLPDYYARIMPQYRDVFEQSRKASSHKTRNRYEKGLRLERALGYSKNLSRIAKEHFDCIHGGNYLRYRFCFNDLNLLSERGTLLIISLRNKSAYSSLILHDMWEDVAGRVAASSHRFIDYAYLLSLSEGGVTYYCCYESSHFYDVLIDIVRASYRDAIGGIPDVVVEREQFR